MGRWRQHGHPVGTGHPSSLRKFLLKLMCKACRHSKRWCSAAQLYYSISLAGQVTWKTKAMFITYYSLKSNYITFLTTGSWKKITLLSNAYLLHTDYECTFVSHHQPSEVPNRVTDNDLYILVYINKNKNIMLKMVFPFWKIKIVKVD